MIPVHHRRIDRALIVADEQEARDAYEYVIEEMGIRAHKVTDGLQKQVKPFLASINPNDVILCDFHLKRHNYAPCNGDELMALCFQSGFTGALCASLSESLIRRDYLRYVPGLIRSGNPLAEDLVRAWNRCRRELAGDFEPTRRPWRTLVRVDEVDHERRCFYAVVPSWDVRTKVRIYNDNLPEDMSKLIEPDRRFHAMVNTGAESSSDLFFYQWEPR